MPVKLDARDRKVLLIAGAIFLVLVAGALIFAGGEESTAENPTTYSAGSGGAKAAYLLLKEAGYKVERWERSPAELPDPAGKLLIVAEPAAFPTTAERQRLQQFVKDGGRLIATGTFASLFLPQGSASPDPLSGMTWKRVPAVSLSAITRAAPEITLAPQAAWKSSASDAPLYGDGESVLVVKYSFGKGSVIWWASATPLTNAGLKEAGNLEFFLACLGEPGSGEILWDEYFHGYRSSLAASAAQSPVKWLFVQLGFLSLTVLITFSRRSLPIFVPASDIRLSPLEFVQTLGGLYERAKAGPVAVDVSYQRFRYWLTRRLALASNASIEDLQRSVRDRWNFADDNFVTTLKECESARYHTDLRPQEALRLVRALHQYAAKLKLFPAKEKI